MDQKFTNQYHITFDLYKEWANNPIGRFAIHNRKKGICLRISGIVLSIIIIVIGALLQEYYVILMGTAFFVIFILRLLIIPNRILKRQYDLILRTKDNNKGIRTTTFSDNIVIEDGKSTTHYEYSEILKISEDKKYFYLFLNEDMILKIRKDSFILGSCDDFGAFINSAILCKAQ